MTSVHPGTMSELYGRIDLSKTNYNVTLEYKVLQHPDVERISSIYRDYCLYKQFESVMPLFREEFFYPQTDMIAYYDEDVIVGFTMMFRYNTHSVAAAQFAWTYHKPEIRLGINSLHHICAYYKSERYKYLYLGDAAEYKQSLDGFEICGPI